MSGPTESWATGHLKDQLSAFQLPRSGLSEWVKWAWAYAYLTSVCVGESEHSSPYRNLRRRMNQQESFPDDWHYIKSILQILFFKNLKNKGLQLNAAVLHGETLEEQFCAKNKYGANNVAHHSHKESPQM